MLGGTQCFYSDVYNCKCTDIAINGSVNCPSEASISEAGSRNIDLARLAVNRKGHMVALPISNDDEGINATLRRSLLLGSGIHEDSGKYAENMKVSEDGKRFVKRIKICKCHISDDDVMEGLREGTLTLKKTATIKSVGFLLNTSAPVRKEPLTRAMESVAEELPGVKKYKQDNEASQKDMLDTIKSLQLKNDKLQEELSECRRKISLLEGTCARERKENEFLSQQMEMMYDYTDKLEELLHMREEECRILRAEADTLETDLRLMLEKRYCIYS